MVVLEAMAAGKPIVTTNVGENKHIIDDGENGFIVEPKDTHNMVLALEKLICDNDLRTMFGSRAKLKYEVNYTAEIMTRQYERLYQDILSQ
jgi:glycosyltransferase involved in cell wall biosynthesis